MADARKMELDAMLKDFCSGLDDVPMAAPAPNNDGPAAPKRKSDGSEPSAKEKKKKRKDKTGSEASAVKKEEVKDEAEASGVKKEEVKVKREPLDTPITTSPSVEVKLGLTGPDGKAVQETSPASNGVQIKDWLNKRVKIEKDPSTLAASSAEPTPIKAEPQGVEAMKIEPLGPQGAAGATGPYKTEEDGRLWFFFVDAFEDDRSSPPRVYMFGKVQMKAGGYQSCCLVVERIERCIHLLLNVNDPDAIDVSSKESDEDRAKAQVAADEAAAAVEAEFMQLCRQQCPGFKKLRSALKWRNYAFEKSVPQGGGCLPFLKVICEASSQMPFQGLSGQTFSHMFGATTSLLEGLLITRRIVGPSWICLAPSSWTEDPARLTYSSVELRITPQAIIAPKNEDDKRKLAEMGMPISSPPLRIMSLAMQTVQRSPQQPHEPLAVACTMHPLVSPDAGESERELRVGMEVWKGVRRFDANPFPRGTEQLLDEKGVRHFSTEVALLSALLAKIQELDPDVIAGHNAYGFDLDVLAARLSTLKVQCWQKLGRLRRSRDRMPRVEGRQGSGFWLGANLTAGRLIVDLMLQAKDLLPKLQQYDLPTLAASEVGMDKLRMIEPESMRSYFSSSQGIHELTEVTQNNAWAIARLVYALQILPLSKQLTNLAGNLWNASLQNKRAERNEMLLCHEFHKKKFVTPDRESFLSKKRKSMPHGTGLDDAEEQEPAAVGAGAGPRRGKAQYSGGLVLEPKAGLYEEFVLLLDFNSLYPSIIQEHNICFTTVDRPNEAEVTKIAGEAELLAKTHLPDGMDQDGILPQVLRRLVESRATVKMAIKSEKDPRRLKMLEIRQKALKLTANSMYGCLGFQNSRFYAKPLAAMITAKGREALQSTINIVEQELQLDVVYGDTDSVFVNSKTNDFNAAMAVAQQIKRSVNKRYKRLEIEIDGVFARLMLLKKKKYAALKVVNWESKTFEHELKGLDIVRRDWCGIAKEMGEKIILKFLSGEEQEAAVNWTHNYLSEKCLEMDERKVPLERYVITKGLTKAPQDYPDAKNQPHVQVALRLISRGKSVLAGQEIGYVVCEPTGQEGGNGKVSMADRARHPHEFQLDPTLRVDVEWYKKQQVHPLISRTLAPIQSTDAARIAECLGMDTARFAQAAAREDDLEAAEMASVAAAHADVNALFDRKLRWKDYQSTLPGIQCLKCKQCTPWKHLLRPEGESWDGVNALFRCAGSSENPCGELINPRRAQNLLTMQVRELLKEHLRGWVRCTEDTCMEKTRRLTCGQNMVSERMVLRELEYMEYLCESEKDLHGDDPRSCRESVKGMHKVVSWMLECNSYNWVDCGQIFSGMFTSGGQAPLTVA